MKNILKIGFRGFEKILNIFLTIQSHRITYENKFLKIFSCSFPASKTLDIYMQKLVVRKLVISVRFLFFVFQISLLFPRLLSTLQQITNFSSG